MSEYNIHSNLNSNGDIVANSFTGSGTNLNISSTNNITTTSNVSGGVLFGDGTQLQNVSSEGITHYSEIIGNGSDTTINITHSLGTISVMVSVIDRNTSTKVYSSVKLIDNNNVELGFSSAPSNDQYYVSIISVGDTLPISFTKVYIAGGYTTSSQSDITTFNVSSYTGESGHGNLSIIRNSPYANSSSTQGFASGGHDTSSYTGSIDKFDFSSNTTASGHGTGQGSMAAGAYADTNSEGFYLGGLGNGGNINRLEKFAYVSNTNTTDVADLSVAARYLGSSQSTTQGFSIAGYSTGYFTTIYKYNFVSTTNTVSHGNIGGSPRNGTTGFYSNTHGFASGGSTGSRVTDIKKFDFVSNTTASDHGDLTIALSSSMGVSLSTSGLVIGGVLASGTRTTNIDTFEYASNTLATKWGDLDVGRSTATHHLN